MFGIGFGEILLIIFIIFLISPRDVPKAMKKLGQFFGELNRIKRELLQMKDDVEEIINESKKEVKEIAEETTKDIKDVADETEMEIKNVKRDVKKEIKDISDENDFNRN